MTDGTETARSHERWQPPGFDRAALARLRQLDGSGHFWPRDRRRLLRGLLDRVSARGDLALELGCGVGDMLPEIAHRFTRVIGVDGYPELLSFARPRVRQAILVQGDVVALPFDDRRFDFVAAFDVIEHVDPDRLLSEARRVARPGGRLMLSAPAFPVLWSAMDEAAGHRCRYRWRGLRDELRRNGWRPDGHTHFQCLLFPLVYVSRRMRPDGLGRERRPTPFVNGVLSVVNRIELVTSRRITLPFGSSLFAWATAT
jgi:SAM-dependent methyltransferase